MKAFLRILPFITWGALCGCFDIHANDGLYWFVLGLITVTPILYKISEEL